MPSVNTRPLYSKLQVFPLVEICVPCKKSYRYFLTWKFVPCTQIYRYFLFWKFIPCTQTYRYFILWKLSLIHTYRYFHTWKFIPSTQTYRYFHTWKLPLVHKRTNISLTGNLSHVHRPTGGNLFPVHKPTGFSLGGNYIHLGYRQNLLDCELIRPHLPTIFGASVFLCTWKSVPVYMQVCAGISTALPEHRK